MTTWTMNWVDSAVLTTYLVGITLFGIWTGYRRNASSEQYFLANKSLGSLTIGAAVFTSNISTIHLVGLAASGAKDGMVIGNFEWMAWFTLMLLGLLFAPFYLKRRVATLPEFVERRYCPAACTFLAVIGLLGGAPHPHRNQPVRRGQTVRELPGRADAANHLRALDLHRHLHLAAFQAAVRTDRLSMLRPVVDAQGRL